MKNLAFLLLALALCLGAAAQKPKVTWGPEYKKEGGMFSYEILLGTDENNFYVLSDPRSKSNLIKFDMKGKQVSSTPVQFMVGKKKLYATGVIKLGEKYYLKFYYGEKKEDFYKIYVTELNGGKPSSKLREICSVPYKFNFFSGTAVNQSNEGDNEGNIKRSPNGKFAAVLGQQVSKNKQEEVKAIVFDENFNVKWEKTYILPITDKKFTLEQFYVTNEGEIYVSGKNYENDEAFKKKLPRFNYNVFHLTDGGFKEYTVELGADIAPWEASIFTAKDGTLLLGGFYTSTSTSSGSADGVFTSRLGKGGFKSSIDKFSQEFMEGLRSKRDEKKDEGLKRFSIDHLVEFEDGSFSFIAEQYYITVHTSTVNGRTTTYYVYHSNEIVIPRFNADGKLVWMAKVDKTYSSRNSYFTSYNYFLKDNVICLVYNDFKSKEERKDLQKGGKYAMFTDLATVDGSGKVNVTTIFSSKETDKFFIPSMSVRTSNGKNIIKAARGMAGKTYSYGVLEIN